uniref:Str_synth domain-containing protein n=1 Tax=Panagrellus redivivus TaxID=6233 RepID=A0A7E4ZRY7_PANRE
MPISLNMTETVDSVNTSIVNDEIVKEIPAGDGRPLGIRHYHDETFIAVDCFVGVVEVDFKTGTIKNLLSIETVINGRKLMIPDALDFISKDTIIFSDASVNFDGHQYAIPLAAGINDGRLIKFNLTSGEYDQIADGFYFPNGIQIHADGESVLVTETGFGCVSRFYFAGPKKGVREAFVKQLPGFPDNISATTKGTYFVAMAVSRMGGWHLLDLIAPYPSLRKLLLQVIPEKYSTVFLSMGPSNGLFIKVDANGNIIDSWQDPSGKIRYISQATDAGNAIYVGSYAHSFLAKIER